jgi:hypothetical protein
MSIPAFLIPILLAHSAGQLAPEPASKAASPAAASWAAAITKRADAGWQLRDLSSSHGADGVFLSMTLASARRAERLTVNYDQGSQSFGDFQRERVAVPSEKRRYDNERALFEELSMGAPVAIDFGCADFYLDFGSRSVSLGEDDFRVSLWSTETQPGVALSTWLSSSLEEGELVDIRDERFDNGAEVRAEVVFVVESDSGVEEMRVALGPDGKPAHLQLQHAPAASGWSSHPASARLRQLASDASIQALHFSDEDWPDAGTLRIELEGDSQVELGLGEFEAEEGECGC